MDYAPITPAPPNELQRRLLQRMREQMSLHRTEGSDISRLSADLRGLFAAADLPARADRDDFEHLWADIDGEAELRTEPWAPQGAASDERLDHALTALEAWTITLENRGS